MSWEFVCEKVTKSSQKIFWGQMHALLTILQISILDWSILPD